MVKHIELLNKEGKTLRGYLTIPDNFNGELVIFYHGYTGNKSEHAYHFRNFSRILSNNGFASLRMDFSGNGESDGEFYEFTMDTMMDEAKLIFEFGKNYEGVKRVDLLGFSMGGGVATMLSAIYKNEINKLILWSAAGSICEHIRRSFDNGIKLENGHSLIGPSFELSQAMVDSTYHYDTFKGIEKYTNPVLLIHGRNDLAVDYLTSMKYSVTYPNALVHIVDGAGHGYDKLNEMNDLYNRSLDFLIKDYKID